MDSINEKLLVDLEVRDKIINAIDMTYTPWGHIQLSDMLHTLYYTNTTLLRRQQIIKSINSKLKIKNYITGELFNIYKRKDSIEWLMNSDNSTDLYFKREYFNKPFILGFSNFMSIYTPSINVIIYVIIYVVLYYLGVKIDIKDYLKKMYDGYKNMVHLALSLMNSQETINSCLSHAIATLYVLYQMYGSVRSIENSIRHREKCINFQKQIKDVYYLIDSIYNIYHIDIFMINEKKLVEDDLIKLVNIFSYDKIQGLGYSLNIKKNLSTYIVSLNKLLTYVGIVDTYVCITNLIMMKGYSIPEFLFNQGSPNVSITKGWNPLLKIDQVTNNFDLGNSRLMIITGANTSGKSTFMRNVMLSVYLSQTIGVACCEKIRFTPFRILFTYINIPDVVGRESLFEAEMNRCMEYINLVKKLDMNEYAFSIIDELFTGTNPKEGIAGSYAICDYMLKYYNSLLMITTHFHDITQLQKIRPSLVINKKFDVDININGNISRNYQLIDGVSEQNIAIHLLKNKGFDPSIIALAKYYTQMS